MTKGNFKVIQKIVIPIIFVLLLITFFSIVLDKKSDAIIDNIKKYIADGNKVVYIASEDNYSEYPIEIFKKYDIDYIYINSDSLTMLEKVKLERLVNSKYLSSIVLIYNNGKIIDAIIEYSDNERLNKFLQDNDLIPKIIGNNSEVIKEALECLDDELTLLYLPYEYGEQVESQSKLLQELSENYDFEYKMIDAYLLSSRQKDKLNSSLGISEVEDQIVILVKDNKIVGNIRGVKSKKDYLNFLTTTNFINDIEEQITEITFEEFEDLLNERDRIVIFIGKNDCKACSNLNSVLTELAAEYNININYLNVDNLESQELLDSVLKDIGYDDANVLPLTFIIEQRRILSYAIGFATKDYFFDIFKENGIIR